MKTNINCIVFEFNPTCQGCGETTNTSVVATVMDLISSGTPTCEYCGDDYTIKDECEVRA